MKGDSSMKVHLHWGGGNVGGTSWNGFGATTSLKTMLDNSPLMKLWIQNEPNMLNVIRCLSGVHIDHFEHTWDIIIVLLSHHRVLRWLSYCQSLFKVNKDGVNTILLITDNKTLKRTSSNVQTPSKYHGRICSVHIESIIYKVLKIIF